MNIVLESLLHYLLNINETAYSDICYIGILQIPYLDHSPQPVHQSLIFSHSASDHDGMPNVKESFHPAIAIR